VAAKPVACATGTYSAAGVSQCSNCTNKPTGVMNGNNAKENEDYEYTSTGATSNNCPVEALRCAPNYQLKDGKCETCATGCGCQIGEYIDANGSKCSACENKPDNVKDGATKGTDYEYVDGCNVVALLCASGYYLKDGGCETCIGGCNCTGDKAGPVCDGEACNYSYVKGCCDQKGRNILCPAGIYCIETEEICEDVVQDTGRVCKDGYYCPEGSTTDRGKPRNTYWNFETSDVCVKDSECECSNGPKNHNSTFEYTGPGKDGKNNCPWQITCAAGTGWDVTDQQCNPCQNGQYNAESTVDSDGDVSSKCEPCDNMPTNHGGVGPSGYTGPGVNGANNCPWRLTCGAGTYFKYNETESERKCADCTNGNYCDEPTEADHNTTADTGLKSCSNTFGSLFKKSDGGRASSTGNPSAPQHCYIPLLKNEHISDRNDPKKTPCSCTEDEKFWRDAGKYYYDEDNQECNECTTKSDSPGAKYSCDNVDDLTDNCPWSMSCNPGQQYEYNNSSQTGRCTPCSPGTARDSALEVESTNTNSKPCPGCGDKTYQDQSGQTQCKLCPGATWSIAGDDTKPGATSMAQCHLKPSNEICEKTCPTCDVTCYTLSEIFGLNEGTNCYYNPSPTETEDIWLAAWRSHSGTLPSSSSKYEHYQTPWSVTASVGNYGSQTVSGESLCSSTDGGSLGIIDNPSTTDGRYCWCKMTSPRAGSWVFRFGGSNASHCSSDCASNCATYVRFISEFRRAALTISTP